MQTVRTVSGTVVVVVAGRGLDTDDLGTAVVPCGTSNTPVSLVPCVMVSFFLRLLFLMLSAL